MIKIIKTETTTENKNTHILYDGSFLMDSDFKQGYPSITYHGIDNKECFIVERDLKIPNKQAIQSEYAYLDTAINIDSSLFYTHYTSLTKINDNVIIPMSNMKPLQVGIVVGDTYPSYKGHYVMRTKSFFHFEVIDLTIERTDCWTSKDCSLKVRLLNPEEKITLELSN